MSPSTCVVLVPCGGTIARECEEGLRGLEASGYQVQRVRGFSAIDFGRSVLASRALQAGFNELMWVDADVGFDPRDVDRLRSRGLPFTCGLYPKKDLTGFAGEFPPGVRDVTLGAAGGLAEVLYAGFGFAHTRLEVYDRIRQRCGLTECNQRFGPPIVPWFLPEVMPDGTGARYLSEDYAFCYRARLAGMSIVADTTIRLSHVGTYAFTWDDLRRKRSEKSILGESA